MESRKFDLIEFLQNTLETTEYQTNDGKRFFTQNIRPRITCNDGFSMSVQASEYHYCSPRRNSAEYYSSVEVGFPSEEEILLEDYAEDRSILTSTVYGYVPVDIVEAIIEKHGGAKIDND